jgi:hypothetical protein
MANNIFVGVVSILVGFAFLCVGAIIDHAPAIPTLLLTALVFAIGVLFGINHHD